MSPSRPLACGTWPSPISAERINLEVLTVDDTLVDTATSTIYHIVNKGIKGGESVIIDSASGVEVVGEPFNVKTLVNSYGRAAAVVSKGLFYFNNLVDHRIYKKQSLENESTPVSPDTRDFRFAHICIHPRYPELIVSIMEDHSKGIPNEAITSLVCIDTRMQTVTTLVTGADFYINPIFNSDGSKLAWIQWSYPSMQWHGSELFVANVRTATETGGSQLLTLYEVTKIAGEPGQNSVFQAHWLPAVGAENARLLFTWDKDTLCEPWIWTGSSRSETNLAPVLPRSHPVMVDFSLPVWWLDDSFFAVLTEDLCICTTVLRGVCMLNVMALSAKMLLPIKTEYVTISRLRRVNSCSVVFIATTATTDAEIVRATFDSSRWTEPEFKVLSSVHSDPLDESFISCGNAIEITKSNGEVTYANFYSPKHPEYIPLLHERPPCILSLHSGPTYHCSLAFTWYRQFYTTRGFAWLDVEYSGSSGFGKAYRDRLDGNYGQIEIDDVLEVANKLSVTGYFDRERIILRSSSGGTLPQMQTFVTHPTSFAGAAAHFVIVDPAKLVPGPDKFTKHYVEKLMGGTPEEIPDVYRERSPLLHASRIERPLLITHAKDSPTFGQAESIVRAVQEKKGTVYFTSFPTIDSDAFKLLYDVELAFFQDVLVTKEV